MQKLKSIDVFYLKLVIIIFLILLPWTIYSPNNNLEAEKITSDLAFYEINTCNVTLTNFLLNNPNTIYQNHYKFVTNNYSSARCFGKITGVSQIGNDFSISVGTNSFINLLLQGIFWIFLFWLIKKSEKEYVSKKYHHYSSILLTCFILCFLIASEARFYEKTLYFFNLDSRRSYILIFLILFFISINLIDIINKRFYNILHFLPFTFLIVGTFSGFNLNIYFLPCIYYGLIAIFEGKINKKFLTLLSILIFTWTINGIGGDFFLKPDKIRGFTSSYYNYDTVVCWSLVFFLSLFGLYYVIISTKNSLNFEYFKNIFSVTSIPLLVFGYFGANAPGLNFYSLYFFGQQKITTTQINPLAYNEWGEKLAWRGFSSSAESIGEFYGIAILFCLFSIFITKKYKLFNFICLLFSVLGLYFSNNRASFLMCIFAILIYINYKLEIKRFTKIAIFLSVLIATILFIGVENFTYVYSYYSVFIQANNYSIEGYSSSFVNLLNEKYLESGLFALLFSIFSFIGFIFNRSELWGLFFSRYNPNYFEYLFGSGPVNFGQFYGEVAVVDTPSFLMPHSSYLSMLVFFGMIGTFLLIVIFWSRIIFLRKYINVYEFIFLLFIFINLIKSDSLNYFNSLMIYSFITIISLQKKSRFINFRS